MMGCANKNKGDYSITSYPLNWLKTKLLLFVSNEFSDG